MQMRCKAELGLRNKHAPAGRAPDSLDDISTTSPVLPAGGCAGADNGGTDELQHVAPAAAGAAKPPKEKRRGRARRRAATGAA
jgi:hypothetical protein